MMGEEKKIGNILIELEKISIIRKKRKVISKRRELKGGEPFDNIKRAAAAPSLKEGWGDFLKLQKQN